MSTKNVMSLLLAIVVIFGVGSSASALSYQVQVGYADDIRSSPFFPNPWIGGANVDAFLGGGGSFDAGAIRLINTSATPITLDAFSVSGFGDGTVYNIWGGLIGAGVTFNPGKSIILTQTGSYDFDSSDNWGGNPLALPVVHVTINGVAQSFTDTAQVLNTEGTDALAAAGLNESHQWRDIGTVRGQAGTPEPGSLAMLLGSGIPGSLLVIRRRKKSA